ncbi:hypothetical protein GGI20_001390 [Coemansia sp. BCRC 34301]|nr:hypothetical protein GGI20_001390 [Coemansia sp. BCRC 34301]
MPNNPAMPRTLITSSEANKPLSAYQLFCRSIRHKIEGHSGIGKDEMHDILVKKWEETPQVERELYYAHGRHLEEMYNNALAEYMASRYIDSDHDNCSSNPDKDANPRLPLDSEASDGAQPTVSKKRKKKGPNVHRSKVSDYRLDIGLDLDLELEGSSRRKRKKAPRKGSRLPSGNTD